MITEPHEDGVFEVVNSHGKHLVLYENGQKYFSCPTLYGFTCLHGIITDSAGIFCEDPNFSRLSRELTKDDINAMKKMKRGKKLDKFVTDKLIEYKVYCYRSDDK